MVLSKEGKKIYMRDYRRSEKGKAARRREVEKRKENDKYRNYHREYQRKRREMGKYIGMKMENDVILIFD